MPINVTDVWFGYRTGQSVVRGASFAVADGEMLALTGPSGSGKSTLLGLLGHLLRPQTGTITGAPALSDTRWIFQVPTALGRRTVLDNVRLALLLTTSEPSRTRTALDALSRVGLDECATRRTNTLSGGQLQRVQVARALDD